MNVSTSLNPGARAAQAGAAPVRRITDAPTRMFHWLFALSFLGAYLTADGERWRMLHVTLGYTMAGLLAFRVLYGLFGPRQAGLGLLWRKLTAAPAWLRSLRAAASGRRYGRCRGVRRRWCGSCGTTHRTRSCRNSRANGSASPACSTACTSSRSGASRRPSPGCGGMRADSGDRTGHGEDVPHHGRVIVRSCE